MDEQAKRVRMAQQINENRAALGVGALVWMVLIGEWLAHGRMILKALRGLAQ